VRRLAAAVPLGRLAALPRNVPAVATRDSFTGALIAAGQLYRRADSDIAMVQSACCGRGFRLSTDASEPQVIQKGSILPLRFTLTPAPHRLVNGASRHSSHELRSGADRAHSLRSQGEGSITEAF